MAIKFGLSTLTRGVFSRREAYMAVAKAAERAGFDFLSVSDHLIVPAKLRSHYPYTAAAPSPPPSTATAWISWRPSPSSPAAPSDCVC